MLHSPTRINPHARSALIIGSVFMFLGVMLGAFGAHGLKKMVEPTLLETWEAKVVRLVRKMSFNI